MSRLDQPQQRFGTTREGAENKESNDKKLLKLYRAGFPEPEQIFGYHGTSIEAIDALRRTGFYPGSSYEVEGERGMYIAPNTAQLPGVWMSRMVGIGLGSSEAEDFAKSSAQIHYVMKSLGIPFKTQYGGRFSAFLMQTLDGMRRTLEEKSNESLVKKFGKERIEKVIQEAENRRGVLLSISKKVLEAYPVKVVEPVTEDLPNHDTAHLYIHTKTGVGIDYFNGLKALGDEEKKYFEALDVV
jgi:hypothetical protein